MNREKYFNAVLFFAQNTPNLGKVKLNKLLYYLDFDHFEKYGQAVTEDAYVNKKLGPVPVHMDNILTELVGRNEIEVIPEPVIDFTRYKIVSRIPYNPNVFKPSEIAMLCEVNEKWGHLTAKEIVAATHGEAPWIATRDGEEIPYALSYYRGKYAADESDTEVTEGVASGYLG